MNLLDFVEGLPYEEAQPIQVQRQGEFVAVIQMDGAGEDRHWVLVPIAEVAGFIQKVIEVAV